MGYIKYFVSKIRHFLRLLCVYFIWKGHFTFCNGMEIEVYIYFGAMDTNVILLTLAHPQPLFSFIRIPACASSDRDRIYPIFHLHRSLLLSS